MKRLNLDETWTLCLKMWRWIAKQKKAGSRKSVETLKKEWLVNHGYKDDDDLASNCFFCEYAFESEGCNKCPARKIDLQFDCVYTSYDYQDEPLAFLAKLVELNKIRLKRKRGGSQAKEGRKAKKDSKRK